MRQCIICKNRLNWFSTHLLNLVACRKCMTLINLGCTDRDAVYLKNTCKNPVGLVTEGYTATNVKDWTGGLEVYELKEEIRSL